MNPDPAKKLAQGDDSRKNWTEINKLTAQQLRQEKRLQRLELLNDRRLIKNGGAGNGDPVWL